MVNNNAIWLIYLLLLFGYSFSHGFFSFSGILLLLFTLIIFLYYFLKREYRVNSYANIISIPSLLIITYSLCLILYGGLYQNDFSLKLVSHFITFINLILITVFLTITEKKHVRLLFYFIISFNILLRIFMVISSPNPIIDVYDYIKYGAIALSHGQNPYAIMYHKIYPNLNPDYYGYLPGTLLMTLPSVIFLNDPRYTLIMADIFAAFIIWKTLKGKKEGMLLALLFLGNPMSLYVLEQSYIEPIMLVIISLYLYERQKGRLYLSSAVMGILLSIKQDLLLLPLLAVWLDLKARFALKSVVIYLSVFLMIVLPFFLWSPKDFIHDAVTLQYFFPPRYEGLTFYSLLYQLKGFTYSLWSSLVLIIIPFLIIFISFRKKPMKLPDLILSFALSMYIFFLFNKWAFLNYYFFISQLLVIYMVFSKSEFSDK